MTANSCSPFPTPNLDVTAGDTVLFLEVPAEEVEAFDYVAGLDSQVEAPEVVGFRVLLIPTDGEPAVNLLAGGTVRVARVVPAAR